MAGSQGPPRLATRTAAPALDQAAARGHFLIHGTRPADAGQRIGAWIKGGLAAALAHGAITAGFGLGTFIDPAPGGR
jgi:hypothetical protein